LTISGEDVAEQRELEVGPKLGWEKKAGRKATVRETKERRNAKRTIT
jgi:hypothetical protein